MKAVNTVALVLIVHLFATPQAQNAGRVHVPSRFTYAVLYCTPDGSSHFRDVTVELPKLDFAPPAAPIHIGGQVPASSVFFGGFEAGWGVEDLKRRIYHPAATWLFHFFCSCNYLTLEMIKSRYVARVLLHAGRNIQIEHKTLRNF